MIPLPAPTSDRVCRTPFACIPTREGHNLTPVANHLVPQGDRTNLIVLLPESKTGSPVTNEAGLEPDTWARAPRWRAWQAAPPRRHGHPDGLRSAHLGSSPLVRGSWWRPQRRRCATGSVVLLGWCDHPVSNCRGPHPTFVSPAATSPSVAVTGISAKEGQSSDTDGAAGAAD
jgi:hypothetical protein